MKSSRQGFGVQPSWPIDSPLLPVSIDHCLVIKDDILVIDSWIDQDVGLDHYPLIADLSLS